MDDIPDSNGVRMEWTLRDGPQEAELQRVYDHLDRVYTAINQFRQQFGRSPSIDEQMTMIDALAPP